jgi:hypothetical protein
MKPERGGDASVFLASRKSLTRVRLLRLCPVGSKAANGALVVTVSALSESLTTRDADNCTCRKPKPGLIFTAAEKYGIDLASSYIIGDRWRDVAGCRTNFVDHGFVQDQPATADQTVKSLAEAADVILQANEKE